MSKETWHGWIVVVKEAGYADHFHVEYSDENGVRRRELDTTSPAECIEWWDKRLKKPIKLIATPLGAYRVYTEEEGAQEQELAKLCHCGAYEVGTMRGHYFERCER